MSALGGIAVAIAGTLEDILLSVPNRGIANILPNVVVQESAQDELTITEHPVESGANITDHAFKNPALLSVTYGWSQSGTALNGLISGAGLTPSPRDVYQQLLDLQESRQPFNVVTGKRLYENMLIRSLSQVTDVEGENCLLVDMDLQEIIIVSTQTTSTLDNAADPAQNSDLSNLGPQQIRDATANYTGQQLIDAGVMSDATIEFIPGP